MTLRPRICKNNVENTTEETERPTPWTNSKKLKNHHQQLKMQHWSLLLAA